MGTEGVSLGAQSRAGPPTPPVTELESAAGTRTVAAPSVHALRPTELRLLLKFHKIEEVRAKPISAFS